MPSFRLVSLVRSAARMLLPITTAAQAAIGASAKQFEQRRQQAMKLRFDQLKAAAARSVSEED